MTPHMLSADPRAFAVCMGLDAMRIAIGMKPRNFDAKEVIRWLRLMAATPAATKGERK